jgi:hypothetical protein
VPARLRGKINHDDVGFTIGTTMDVIRVSKTINAPLRYVYEWCTDFREDDPQITGSKSQRKVLEKTRKQTTVDR